MELLRQHASAVAAQGGQAMHSSHINQRWHENNRYSENAEQKRRAPRRVSRVLVCILAIAAGAAALVEQSGIGDAPKLGHVHIRI